LPGVRSPSAPSDGGPSAIEVRLLSEPRVTGPPNEPVPSIASALSVGGPLRDSWARSLRPARRCTVSMTPNAPIVGGPAGSPIAASRACCWSCQRALLAEGPASSEPSIRTIALTKPLCRRYVGAQAPAAALLLVHREAYHKHAQAAHQQRAVDRSVPQATPNYVPGQGQSDSIERACERGTAGKWW
jgi:hypothetical protein